MKETNDNMDQLLSALNYHDHGWLLCEDSKVVGLVLGLQGGYTKYQCFLRFRDSRSDDQHYKIQRMESGSYSVQSSPLVEPNKILLPPLHIKLGLMKNFVKALGREGRGFTFFRQKFPRISLEKLKVRIFDDIFDEKEVDELLKSFQELGARMSIKLHLLRSHLDCFPQNCEDSSEEQGERFHQDIRVMEERCQGRWDVNALADYCWCLKRDMAATYQSRKSLKRLFIHISFCKMYNIYFLNFAR